MDRTPTRTGPLPAPILALLVTVAVLAVLAMLTTPIDGATLVHLNLLEMVERADRIFIGTVEQVESDTVAAGGIEIPIRIFHIRAQESFRGLNTLVPGGDQVEIRMLAPGGSVRSGEAKSLPALPDLPDLQVGERYFLFTTAPSAIGLSTTVGLGQGRFHITGAAGEESAINQFGNIGLFRDMEETGLPGQGPLPLAQLSGLVRDQLEAE